MNGCPPGGVRDSGTGCGAGQGMGALVCGMSCVPLRPCISGLERLSGLSPGRGGLLVRSPTAGRGSPAIRAIRSIVVCERAGAKGASATTKSAIDW
jgi:hypothetical protein